MMRTIAMFALGLGACGDYQPVGIEEPIKVENGTFHPEVMPGFEPSTSDVSGPRVTSIETASTVIRQGELGREFLGNVTEDAYVIGVQFEDHGSGWWGTSVLGPDTAIPGELVFRLNADFGEIPSGPQRLRFAAIDAEGNGGPFNYLAVCVPSQVPDNRNSCDSTRVPPATVVALQFGNRADVDLVLVGPDGRVVDAKRPTGGPSANANDPTNPRLDRDSNTHCVPDGFNRENVIFQEDPSEGSWDVYVNLFHACEQAAVTFVVEIYRRVDHGDGTYGVELTDRTTGTLLAQDANGGTGPNLYVTTFQFP